MNVDKIFPSSLEIKYNYIELDGIFVSTITITKYDLNIEMLKTMKTLLTRDEIEISMQLERKNNSDFLKELTNIISKSNSEIRTISKNQIDINVLDEIKQNALDLRKKIQIDNEQIYMLSTYITVKANDYIELVNKTRNIINMLYSNNIIAKPCNFKQKEGYIATIPIMQNSNLLKKYTNCAFTERGIAKLFPFFNENIFEENGTILGFANNSICSIDNFSLKNNNYNMCIFGTSGTGKSYLVKLMLIRNSYKKISQIVIDPEGEYEEIIRRLGGKVITIENFNPFYISETFVIDNDFFFDQKVNNVAEILCQRYNFKDINKIKEYVVKTYNEYSINKDKNSLYKTKDRDIFYTKPKYISEFPSIDDFKNVLKKENYNEFVKIKKINYMYNTDYITWNEGLYCFSLKNKTINEITRSMKYFLPFIYEILKDNSLIYFDEVWKLIGSTKDNFVIENVYNMYKTLRKKHAGIAIISQDITDLFNVDNGNFGKSILNNSNMKVLFKMEWTDLEVFERLRMTKEKIDRIKGLDRGNCYIELNSTNFNLEIKATDYEHKLIEGE